MRIFNDAVRGPYIKVYYDEIPDDIYYHPMRLGQYVRELVEVARINDAARKRRRRSRLSGRVWQAILARFGNRCAYCGTDGRLQQDHRLPVHLGGLTTVANIVPACPPCNSRKRAQHPDRWPLRTGV